MQRYASVIGMPYENREEYERLHAAVWPEVLAKIAEVNIQNYSIYRYGELLFSYFAICKLFNKGFNKNQEIIGINKE